MEECHRLSDEEVLPKVQAVPQEGDPSDPTFRWAAEYVARFSKVPKGVHSETAPVAAMPPEEMERALNAALRDPAVRMWLEQEKPELLARLRGELHRLAPPS